MVRSLKITNVYGDDEIVTHATLDVPDGIDDDDLRDLVQPLTGTGRTGRAYRHAGYFVESDDGLEPAINVEFC
jgi:hypothetical protein